MLCFQFLLLPTFSLSPPPRLTLFPLTICPFPSLLLVVPAHVEQELPFYKQVWQYFLTRPVSQRVSDELGGIVITEDHIQLETQVLKLIAPYDDTLPRMLHDFFATPDYNNAAGAAVHDPDTNGNETDEFGEDSSTERS